MTIHSFTLLWPHSTLCHPLVWNTANINETTICHMDHMFQFILFFPLNLCNSQKQNVFPRILSHNRRAIYYKMYNNFSHALDFRSKFSFMIRCVEQLLSYDTKVSKILPIPITGCMNDKCLSTEGKCPQVFKQTHKPIHKTLHCIAYIQLSTIYHYLIYRQLNVSHRDQFFLNCRCCYLLTGSRHKI